MSSNTAPIESEPFKSRLRPLGPPVSLERIRSTTVDSTHEVKKTPDNPNPQFQFPPATSLTTGADLLAGQRVKPKTHSGLTPAPWAKHDGHVMPEWSGTRQKPPKQWLRHIYHPYEGVRLPTNHSHRLPLQQISAPRYEDIAARDASAARSASLHQEPYQRYQERQLLEQGVVGLSLQPHATEQQGYTGEQNSHVQVRHYPDLLQSVPPQQQQLSQQPSFRHGQYAQALPPLHPQLNVFPQQQQQYPSQALQLPIPAKRISSGDVSIPPASQTAVPIFFEAREDLQRLQADIADLSDSSDGSPEDVGSDLGMTRLSLSEECSDHTTNNVREETSVGSSESQGLHMNTGEEASSSGGSPAQKRSQLDDHNEDDTRAEICVSHKRTKLSSLRFICCFHSGPGRKCSGTDETISEALKKLSEQHDTHVCDRCWVLKVKDGSSGLFVHPNGGETCRDHCLSPQCHKTPSSIGHRHEFDPKTCGTKTSRVRPGDREAVYRFIFHLVHPDLMCPSSVLTAEHALHLDAVPRQSRRKLNKEELAARANDLEKRLEAGEQQNAVNAVRIALLEQDLVDAHRATARAEERIAALEKQSRRIVAMLSDALRTGVFLNALDHQSLLRRVEEDAPDALVHQSQSLPTPSASDRSRNSSATPARCNVAGPDPFAQPATYDGSAAPLRTTPGEHTMDGDMSDPWANDPYMDQIWDSLVDEQGDSDTTGSQSQRIDNGDRW